MTKKGKITKLILEDKTSIIINLQQNLQLNDVSILIINNTKFNSLDQIEKLLINISKKSKNLIIVRPYWRPYWKQEILPGDVAELGLEKISKEFKKNANKMNKTLKKFPKRPKSSDSYYEDMIKEDNSGSIWQLIFELRLKHYELSPSQRSKLQEEGPFQYYYQEVLPSYAIGQLKIIPISIWDNDAEYVEDDLLNVFAKFTGAKIITSFKKIQMKDIGFAKKVVLHKTSDDPFAKDKIILNKS